MPCSSFKGRLRVAGEVVRAKTRGFHSCSRQLHRLVSQPTQHSRQYARIKWDIVVNRTDTSGPLDGSYRPRLAPVLHHRSSGQNQVKKPRPTTYGRKITVQNRLVQLSSRIAFSFTRVYSRTQSANFQKLRDIFRWLLLVSQERRTRRPKLNI
ncbi:hypothetical protein CPB86DRAFT_130808 [Serendipita vermifera]|nr:hypothetical protein CPB86DRAFT_130808 [Serendipita vermifera]